MANSLYFQSVYIVLLHISGAPGEPFSTNKNKLSSSGIVLQGYGSRNMGSKTPTNYLGSLGQNSVSQVFHKPQLPAASAKCPETMFEVMDFYVPQFPHQGQDMVLTCGFGHQEDLVFHYLEWTRTMYEEQQTTGSLFFRYKEGRSEIFRREPATFILKGKDWGHQGVTVRGGKREKNHNILILRLHNIGSEKSGRYMCRIMMKKPGGGMVEANTTSTVKVVTPSDPENFNPHLEIRNSSHAGGDDDQLDCQAQGIPAPHLDWFKVLAGGGEEIVRDELLEYIPTVPDDNGVEMALVRMNVKLGENKGGLFFCRAISRNGQSVVAHVQAYEEVNDIQFDILGITTTAAPVPPPPEPNHFWLIFITSSVLSCLFCLCVCCCCCICCRRRKQRARREKALERLENERMKGQNSILHKGWTKEQRRIRAQLTRSTNTSSTKRKAPLPGSTSTLSID